MMTDYRTSHLTMIAQPDAAAALVPVPTFAGTAKRQTTVPSGRVRGGMNTGGSRVLSARCARC